MAKRHPADDLLSGALEILNGIEASTAGWVSDKTGEQAAVPADGVCASELAGAAADVAAAVKGMETAEAGKSPLVRFIRHLDDDIHMVIAQAAGSEPLSFPEKMLRGLRLRRTPQDLRRRDGALADRLVTSLERASKLVTALHMHRQIMKTRLSLMEEDVIERIGKTRSTDDSAVVQATEQLAARQDVTEAIIRHEAVCNLLYHKLTIEAERGIVVLRALNGGQALPLADRFSTEAQGTFSSLLSLCEKNMLSMREVERRRHAVDDSFRHRFGSVPARRTEEPVATQANSHTEQAPA